MSENVHQAAHELENATYRYLSFLTQLKDQDRVKGTCLHEAIERLIWVVGLLVRAELDINHNTTLREVD